MSFELCWLLGPALAGLLATLLWPGTALAVASTLATVAAVGFALTAAVRSHPGNVKPTDVAATEPAPGDRGPVLVGTVHRRGLATLLAATSGFGLGIGFVVVGVTAGAAAYGLPQLAGILLAAWSVSSVVGGLVYQRWSWPNAIEARLPALMATFGLLLLIPALIDSMVALAVTMVLAGVTLVPQITTHNALLDGLAAGPRLTEAYGWITTAVAVANAAGQAAGGLAIQHHGHSVGFLARAACVVPLALVVWVRRRGLLGAG